MTHAELVAYASRWLRTAGRHAVVLSDVRCMATHEQPDVIAWKNTGFSTVLECKTSRADFLRDQVKWFRREAEEGMGYARYFFAPDGIIPKTELPPGWGLLVPAPSARVRIVVKSRPFMRRNERAERALSSTPCVGSPRAGVVACSAKTRP